MKYTFKVDTKWYGIKSFSADYNGNSLVNSWHSFIWDLPITMYCKKNLCETVLPHLMMNAYHYDLFPNRPLQLDNDCVLTISPGGSTEEVVLPVIHDSRKEIPLIVIDSKASSSIIDVRIQWPYVFKGRPLIFRMVGKFTDFEILDRALRGIVDNSLDLSYTDDSFALVSIGSAPIADCDPIKPFSVFSGYVGAANKDERAKEINNAFFQARSKFEVRVLNKHKYAGDLVNCLGIHEMSVSKTDRYFAFHIQCFLK